MPNDTELDSANLQGLVGYQLRQAYLRSSKLFTEIFADSELAPGQYSVLLLAARNPGQTQSSLSVAAGLDRSSIVPIIDKLEARKLLARRSRADDRRSHALFVTAAGAKLLKQVEKRVTEHEARLTEKLSQKEIGTILQLLGKLV